MSNKIKTNSISINFLFDSFLKVTNILFPLITFPYLARVLTPYGLGQYEFLQSIVNLFIIFSQFGVPLYAVRLLSSVRTNKFSLSKTFRELFMINTFSAIITYLFFVIFVFFENRIDFTISLIFGLNLFFSTLSVEWLFQSLEKYSLITIRSFIIKILSLFLIFLMVKSREDLTIYLLILVFSNFLNGLFNFVYSRKFIDYNSKLKLNLFQHFKPIFTFFIINISITLYVNLDKIMLGYIKSDYEVGIYSTGLKIIKLLIVILTSYGSVAFPRISLYFSDGNKYELLNIFRRTLKFILILSIPLITFLFLTSELFIISIGGVEYINSISVFRIFIPLLLILPLSNFLGLQVLMVNKKEKIIFLSTSVGAIVNIILNLILIPNFSFNGAAFATLIAEFLVTLIQFIFTYKLIKTIFSFKDFFKYLLGSFLFIPIIFFLNRFDFNDIIMLVLQSSLSGIIYLIYLSLIGDSLFLKTIENLKRFLNIGVHNGNI
jgi:O-antigen/teichoic acid export membrane protein